MKTIILLLSIVLFSINSSRAECADQLQVIRDTEIEDFLYSIAKPIFKAADLDYKNINIYIINDNGINAFVSGGMNIFINTGLIEYADNYNVLMGVMAHETGHITGGHLARGKEEMKDLSLAMTFGYLAGIAAAATGKVQEGQAIILGSNQAATMSAFSYSRKHEESADQAATRYLASLSESAQGLYNLLDHLNSMFIESYENVNPYTLTHPLSSERMAHLKQYIEASNYKSVVLDKKKQDAFLRVKAKLKGFLNDPDRILKEKSDNSFYSKYMLVIINYRKSNYEKAFQLLNELIKDKPHDPYLDELAGQLYFETGNVDNAITYYKKADLMLPQNTLIKLSIATALIVNEGNLDEALNYLKVIQSREKNDSFLYRQMARIYGLKEDYGLSYLYLAEEALLNDKHKDAILFANMAIKKLTTDKVHTLVAEDIKKIVQKKLTDNHE